MNAIGQLHLLLHRMRQVFIQVQEARQSHLGNRHMKRIIFRRELMADNAKPITYSV